MAIVTYKDVRDFLNSCTEEQLNKHFLIQGEDNTRSIHMPEITEEDFMYDEEYEEEGSVPRSEVISNLENPEDISRWTVSLPAGSIIINEDI